MGEGKKLFKKASKIVDGTSSLKPVILHDAASGEGVWAYYHLYYEFSIMYI